MQFITSISGKLITVISFFCMVHGMTMAQQTVPDWERLLEIKSNWLQDSISGISQIPGVRYKEENKVPEKRLDKNLPARKLFHEHLIQKEDSQFTFRFDPLFIFESGKDSQDSLSSLYRNSRGVQVSGSIGKSFQFQSAFLENQAIFPQHVRAFVAQREVSPGLGRTKIFKVNGSDFGLAWAGFSFKPKPWLMVDGGHGKTFIGSGYRSMLLSDNAFFYPYLKVILHQKNWSYTQSWSMLQDIYLGKELFNPLSEPLFVRKLFTWQYFTFHPTKNLEAGIYYSAIWTHSNASAVLPLPFVQHLQKYPSGAVNPLGGINLSYKVFKSTLVYAQVMLDGSLSKREGRKNTRSGGQLGILIHQPFKVKGLTLQGEINYAEAGAYAQANPTHAYHNGYFHYNQSLTHPLGSNFTEGVGIIHYRYKRFYVSLKGSFYTRNTSKIKVLSDIDPVAENTVDNSINTNSVSNPFVLPNPYSKNGIVADNKIGYVINPATGLKAYCGMLYRNAGSGQMVNYFYLGIGTKILNQYFDF